MSSTILTNWTVYYASDVGASGGYKQIRWTGGSTGTNTVNELYSALADLFSDETQNDAEDTMPMVALTPTLYEIGASDAGDENPWFIDPESVKHLTGGGLNTSSWTREVGNNIGIVKVSYSVGGGSQFVASDIGRTVTTSTDGDSGVLLYFDSTSNVAWIRPDTSAATDSFDATTPSDTLSASGGTGSVTQSAASSTGENIWSNIYTLGTIVDEHEMLVYQNDAALTQWWDTGQIDILVLTTDFDTLIDEGLLTVYARKYGNLYDHFVADVSLGGRTPIPLATSVDLNNTTGYNTISLDAATGTWNVGNYIYYDNGGALTWATTTKKGIITAGDSGATPTLSYYLIGDLTDFVNNDAVTEYDPVAGANGDANGDVNGSPSATTNGPLDTTQATITVTFSGALSQDLSNGNGSRPYDVTIDCQQVALDEVYERLKYITRRGQTTDIDSGTLGLTILGEAYQAVGDVYITYTTGAGSLTEGNTVTGGTSGATGTIVSNHSNTAIVVRDVTGTFVDGESISEGANTGTNIVVETIAPAKQSPFGTFAGGKFFGARGVWLTDYKTTDATNFELIDSTGTQQVPPNNVPIIVDGVVQNTQCFVYDSVPTTYLNATATTPVSGDEYSATTTYGYSTDINVTIRTREMGYLPFETTGTITSSGLSVTAVFLIDPNFKFEVTGETVQFVNGTSTITRGTGNFGTDGWLSIMSQVEVSGSSSNDGTYTITSVSGSDLVVSGSLTNEGPSTGITLIYTRLEPTW